MPKSKDSIPNLLEPEARPTTTWPAQSITEGGRSIKLHAVVARPLLHHAIDHILDLWVVRGADKANDLLQFVRALLPGDDFLKNADGRPALTLPKFGIGIQALEDIERLASVVEVSHLVAIVGNQVKKVKRFVARLHTHIRLPCELGLVADDVASAEPAHVAELGLILLVLHKQEALLGLLVVARGRAGDPVVPVELVDGREIRAD